MFAQKVKVKKGEIFIDEVSVGLVESIGSKQYLFKNKAGEIMFYADFKQKRLSQSEIFETIELKKNPTDTPNIIEAKQFSINLFDYTKYVVENLVLGKVKLINENGFMMTEINDFFKTKVVETVSEETKISAKYQNLRNQSFIVDKDGRIRDGETYIGAIQKKDSIVKRENNTDLSVTNYRVYDIDHNLISKLTSYNLSPELRKKNKDVLERVKDNVIFVFSGQEIIIYGFEEGIPFENTIVKYLSSGGYVLRSQYNDMKGEKNDVFKKAKVVEAAKVVENTNEKKAENSKNFVEKKGYIVDKDGVKTEGEITIYFEDPSTDSGFSGGNILTLGGGDFGKSGKIKYIDANGKKQKDSFKSKNGVKFCVETATESVCFLGLKTTGNDVNKALQMTQLSFDGSMFYKIIFEKNNVYLVQDIKSKNFIIKIPSQEKGIFIKTDLGIIKNEKLSEYFKCDSLQLASLNLTSKEELITILELYLEKCK